MNTSHNSPIHPTLKKCRCGLICTKRELYKHFDDVKRMLKANGDNPREFFACHGESLLLMNDPALQVDQALERSLAQQRYAGERIDNNNQLIPTK